MKNHLIIGLGGSGGKVIKAFRKAYFEEYRDLKSHNSIHVNYMYVDSSNGDLESSRQWRTQDTVGSPIGLSQNELFSITHGDLATRLENPQQFPVTHRYIGDVNLWGDIMTQMNINEGAGGQMRRLGEALFEPKCNEFLASIGNLVGDLEASSRGMGTNFHVIAGLAGGTGSGSFLHVIAQLRNQYPDSTHYKIFLYLILPDENSKWARNGDQTNYYANGYAALQELNAYLSTYQSGDHLNSLYHYSPYDLTGRRERLDRTKDRLQACFLINNVNEAGIVLDLENEDLHGQIAQLLFKRISFFDDGNPALRPVKDAVNLENLVVPEDGAPGDPRNILRSWRFQTFGVKRVVVPEEEIREHLAAGFAQQSLRQMLFNFWNQETSEFLPYGRNRSFAQEVQQNILLEKLKITDDHLVLNKAILEGEKNAGIKSISTDWQEIAPRLKDVAIDAPNDGDGDCRLNKLEQLFAEYYKNNFRRNGVETFYATAIRDVRMPDRHVAELVDTLEKHLLDEWKDGALSASEMGILIDDLARYLRTKAEWISNRIRQLELVENQLMESLAVNDDKWAKVGMLGDWLGRKENIFNSQAGVLEDLYKTRTEKKAWAFAEELRKGYLFELEGMVKERVDKFKAGLNRTLQFFEGISAQTCRVGNQQDAQDHINNKFFDSNCIKFYDPAAIRRLCCSLQEVEQKQNNRAASIRSKLENAARSSTDNARKNLAMMNSLWSSNSGLLIIEGACREQVELVYATNEGDTQAQIGTNIITKLWKEYTSEEALRNYISNLVKSSLTFMRWENVQFGGSSPQAVFAVVLPTCKEEGQREQLVAMFRQALPGNIQFDNIIGTKETEISIFSFKYAFPLRWLKPVWYLKERFATRLKTNSTRANLEVFLEDHVPSLPSLFLPEAGETGKKCLPDIQIALALGLFTRLRNERTGEWERRVSFKDSEMMNKYLYMSDSLISLFERGEGTFPRMNLKQFEQLLGQITPFDHTGVQIAIQQTTSEDESFRTAVQRDKLKDALRKQAENALTNLGDDPRNEIYQMIEKTTRQSIDRVANSAQ